MSNDLISVPRTDLLMAMDELRQSGRDYPADLLKKALFSAPVGAEPVGLSLEVRTLGSYGKAFDLPGNRRAYTYDHQPGNVEASRLGNACQQAAAASAGDTIDRGLGLLKELQAQGFGVFDAESSRWHAAPVAAQPDVTQQTLDDVKAGIPARDAEIEALRKEIETLQAAQAQPTGLVKQLCDALELAKTSHGAMLMSDPPQEMWKARGVDRVISEALNAAQAQQPVSGADGLPTSPTQGMTLGQRIAHVGGRENAQGYVEFGSPMAVNALIQHVLRDLHQAGTSDAPQAQQDHLPDATKMVAADQFRDAAQMIEPSGNSGELPRLPLNDPAAAYRVLHDYGQSCAHAALALSHPDTATYQQAKAWKAVCAALDFVNPRWTEEDGTGEECAVKAIVSLAQQDATLQAEVLGMVLMLEANEWADHCGKSDLGQRLEWAITALQNRIAELTKSSSQQDADKVDAWQCTTTLTESDDLIWLYRQDTNTIDGPVASNPEFIDSWTHWAWVKHPSTASIGTARKEQA